MLAGFLRSPHPTHINLGDIAKVVAQPNSGCTFSSVQKIRPTTDNDSFKQIMNRQPLCPSTRILTAQKSLKADLSTGVSCLEQTHQPQSEAPDPVGP